MWNAGNWTVRGLDGGLYHLQPPGLPALVAVALGIGEWLLPERDPGIYVAALLALVWTLAAHQLWRLAIDITADRLAAMLFVGMILLSAPVYIGGYQLFPESLALLLFPWLYRNLRGQEASLTPLMGAACGLVTGYLLWIHPKLTLIAAFFFVMAILRPATSVAAKALFVAAFALVAFTSLLYCHHISGLFRPEGLYIRQAEEYVGSPNPFSLRFVAGLVKGLVGGRDGLFVFAPILVLGVVATSLRTWFTRVSVELAALFVLVWFTSAVHDGASLGSPARLLAPVVFIPALFLVRTLQEDGRPQLKAAALWLFILGCGITAGMSSDWRKNVNPYRSMFAGAETNFEPSLPGNSFSDAAYVVDIEKGVLILVLAVICGIGLTRSASDEPLNATPALFGLGVLGLVTLLSVTLRWLTPS